MAVPFVDAQYRVGVACGRVATQALTLVHDLAHF